MPELHTPHFGAIQYSESDIYHFPEGLPAFEDHTRFLLIDRPATAPVVYLQSLDDPTLAFLTIPPANVVPDYRLPNQPTPSQGGEPLALAILTVRGASVTANLRAPVVLDPATRTGSQPIPLDSPYSLRHPLPGPGEPACS